MASNEGDAGATPPDERVESKDEEDGFTTSPAEVKEVAPVFFEARALRYAMTVSTDSVDGVALAEPTLSRYFVTACTKVKVGPSVGSASPTLETAALLESDGLSQSCWSAFLSEDDPADVVGPAATT